MVGSPRKRKVPHGRFNRLHWIRKLARKRDQIIRNQARRLVDAYTQLTQLRQSYEELENMYMEQLHRGIDYETDNTRLRQQVAAYQQAHPGPLPFPGVIT
eukprot:1117435-Prorocentrum_lima.AAC.1